LKATEIQSFSPTGRSPRRPTKNAGMKQQVPPPAGAAARPAPPCRRIDIAAPACSDAAAIANFLGIPAMKKEGVRADVPETGAPFNLCVKSGTLIFAPALPPLAGGYAATLREARAKGQPIPPFPDIPFPQQVRIVMDHLKKLVEAAGSNMDCLLKVIVWLKDQRQAEEFDRIYRGYFSNQETLPARTRMQAGPTPLGLWLRVEAIGYAP